MNQLTHKKCVPCEGGAKPLTAAEYASYLPQVTDWEIVEEKKLSREFAFKNFSAALDFLNQTANIAQEEGHHPDILLYGWNKLKITLTTHAIGGLSINDFVLAAKINALTAES